MHYGAPFYITLPSDVILDTYPNTASDWTTKLKQPISLKGRWEVALVELQYVNSIYTILDEASMHAVMEPALLAVPKNHSFTQKEIVIPPGNYQQDNDLLREIEKQIPDMPNFEDTTDGNNGLSRFEKTVPANGKAFTIGFVSPYDHRVKIELPSPRVRFAFSMRNGHHLQKILGFDTQLTTNYDWVRKEFPERVFSKRILFHEMCAAYYENPDKELKNWQSTYVSDRPINSVLGVQSMYVYCDLVDYSIVGDTSAQILRNVPIKGQKHEIVTERFDIPHYVPVLNSHFETIKLNISNDLGESVKFAVGKSVVKLHFRPQKLY